MTNNSDRIDRMEALLQQSIVTSNERMTRLEESSLAFDRRMEQFLANAEADRVVMHEVIDQLVTLRQDNQRILDYLFGQQRGNGHGEQVGE